MKFKKRDLSEQLGMARSNKKTFTKDAKQKIVVSERQLQRLLGAINEAAAPPKGSNNFACMGGVVGQGGTNTCAGPGNYVMGQANVQSVHQTMADCQSTCSNQNTGGTGGGSTGGGAISGPPPNFNFSRWSPNFKKKIDNFIKNRNLDGAKKFLDSRIAGWGAKSKKAGPKWRKQLNQKITFGKKLLTTVAAQKKKKKPIPSTGPTNPNNKTKNLKNKNMKNNKKLNEQFMHYSCEGTCKCVPTPNGTGQYFSLQDCENDTKNCCKPKPPTSPLKGRCCKCRDKVMVNQTRCPKSCPEIKCKGGTPPTQGNIHTESRKLKTTNPINESDIRNMKKWFNRVNKTGTNYNPSID
jgi:hypothetical protein|tara:strand:+ start:1684 stop:2739 length:1056 start_codon:yes stop_codon:yes gene_type:complete